jgi:drug/metabolite transporter (DMT)-like permease
VAVSLFLLRGERKPDEEKKFTVKWLLCILLSVLCAGGFSIVTRMQQEVFDDSVSSEYLIIALGLSSLILFAVGTANAVKKKRFLQVLKFGAPYASFAGIANGATNYLGLVINMMIAISISGPTRSVMKNLLSFLISVFILKEKFLPRQILGLILSTVAVILINIQ